MCLKKFKMIAILYIFKLNVFEDLQCATWRMKKTANSKRLMCFLINYIIISPLNLFICIFTFLAMLNLVIFNYVTYIFNFSFFYQH